MATVGAPHLLTAEEYARLDEVLGFRDELIEGERVLSPSAISPHLAIIKKLVQILESQRKPFEEVVWETGWKFQNAASGAESVLTPDVMVVLAEDWRRAVMKRGWFEGLPLLVIEVISPSERKSHRLRKLGLYLDMGAPNVIEVDYTKRVIQVHTSEAETVHNPGDHITTPFRASVDEIFSILD
jgi:Uma2 family endonuclease